MPDFAKHYNELPPSHRLLLGPGPSLVHPRVLRAMSTPLIGHLDPEFLTIMDEIQELLRWVFQTDNDFTDQSQYWWSQANPLPAYPCDGFAQTMHQDPPSTASRRQGFLV